MADKRERMRRRAARQQVRDEVCRRLRSLSSGELLIETGTYFGEFTRTAARFFKSVWTLELSPVLFEKSKRNLAGYENVSCYHGDSTTTLPVLVDMTVVKKMQSVAFYLDAHFFSRSVPVEYKGKVATSSPFPLWDELKAVTLRPTGVRDVVLIDDVHLWGRSRPDKRWRDVNEKEIARRLLPRKVISSEHLLNRYLAVVE